MSLSPKRLEKLLKRTRPMHDGMVYNPITRNYVVPDGESYQEHDLGRIYSRAQELGFLENNPVPTPGRPQEVKRHGFPGRTACSRAKVYISSDCSLIALHFMQETVRQVRVFRLEKFIKYLREHNDKYNCNYFGPQFYNVVEGCIQRALSQNNSTADVFRPMAERVKEEKAGEVNNEVVTVDENAQRLQNMRNLLRQEGVCSRRSWRKYSMKNHPDRNPDYDVDRYMEVSSAVDGIITSNDIVVTDCVDKYLN